MTSLIAAMLLAGPNPRPVPDVRWLDGVDDYLYTDTAPATGTTFSASFWFIAAPDRPTRQVLWTLLRSNVLGRDDTYRVSLETDGTLRLFARDCVETQSVASIPGVQPGVVYFCCVTSDGPAMRTIYLATHNSLAFITACATEPINPEGIDRMSVGRAADLNPPHAFFEGCISRLTVWNGVALNPAEAFDAKQSGDTIPSVQATAIVGYWPIVGGSPEPDAVGGNHLRVVE